MDATDPSSFFFQGGSALLRLLAVSAPAYAGLVLFLRLSGKRTLSKMNAFDLVVTVAFGSTLATAILSPDTTLVQALLAFAFLVLAQYVITWASVRSRRIQRLVKSQPRLLYFRGRYREDAMRRERVTRVEVEASARQQGFATLARVEAVVLETDGSMSFLEDVDGLDEAGMVRALESSFGEGRAGRADGSGAQGGAHA